MNTLVIVSHPYPSQSTVIRTLAREAESIPDVTVRNLETLYGNDVTGFDIPTEQKAHEGTERIVYLFPLHWFNLTPMMKAYFNEVWSYGWCYGPNGTALKGKEMLVVASAGAAAEAYSHQSPLDCTMEDVLTLWFFTRLQRPMKKHLDSSGKCFLKDCKNESTAHIPEDNFNEQDEIYFLII